MSLDIAQMHAQTALAILEFCEEDKRELSTDELAAIRSYLESIVTKLSKYNETKYTQKDEVSRG